MLSVCIPVYKRDVTELLKRLSVLKEQPESGKHAVEVIVMDDASGDPVLIDKNRYAAEQYGFRYFAQEQNRGRHLIRPLLAAHASYDNLLFLDDDSLITDSLFFQKYISLLPLHNEVYLGGRQYPAVQPALPFLLHWKYGSEREVKGPGSPGRPLFIACNFLISKNLFLSLLTDNTLKGYCHEDTFIGMQLQAKGIELKWTDNPVIHNDLHADTLFLSMQEEAIRSLLYIYRVYGSKFPVSRGMRLLTVFKLFRKMHVLPLLARMEPVINPRLKKNLVSPAPMIKALDLYKLLYASRYWQEQKR